MDREQVVTVAEFPAGLRCAHCRRLIPAGESYGSTPLGMSGAVPVEELVCLECGGRP
jgi:hypothetical protein